MWANSDPAPRAIARLSLRVRSGVPIARIVAQGSAGLVDWGETAARSVYAAGPASGTVAGCLFDYDFGFASAHLQVQLKLGVAVVGSFIWPEEISCNSMHHPVSIGRHDVAKIRQVASLRVAKPILKLDLIALQSCNRRLRCHYLREGKVCHAALRRRVRDHICIHRPRSTCGHVAVESCLLRR